MATSAKQTTDVDVRRTLSAAADEGDDFDDVTVFEDDCGVIGAGDDLAVEFDGEITGIKTAGGQQLPNGQAVW